jgi:hypothetical protein
MTGLVRTVTSLTSLEDNVVRRHALRHHDAGIGHLQANDDPLRGLGGGEDGGEGPGVVSLLEALAIGIDAAAGTE